MQTPPRSRNPLSDWYSPYFGPVTMLVAVAVLVISLQIGKYVGRQALVHEVANLATPAAVHLQRSAHGHKPSPKKQAAHAPRPASPK